MLARHAFRTLITALALASLVACGAAGATATISPSAKAITPASSSSKPITGIEMTRTLAKDGSAASPTTTFDSAKDQQIVAVLALANLDAGTRISYTRFIDTKFVNSKTAVLKHRSKYFHFIFKPKAGGGFTPGSYRMKFYVNDKSSGETTFLVK
jgi:predicted small lipoprotein YifL